MELEQSVINVVIVVGGTDDDEDEDDVDVDVEVEDEDDGQTKLGTIPFETVMTVVVISFE